METIRFDWRGTFDNHELNGLHAEAFAHAPETIDWRGQVERHSLGWVTARDGQGLVGFVNVPWDGGIHAFILDTIVAARAVRCGVGTALVARAAHEARAAGCECLHVDFEERLRPFYIGACGFEPTAAALLRLRDPA